MKVELTIGSGVKELPVTIEELLDPTNVVYVIECGTNKIELEPFQLRELSAAIEMFLKSNRIY